MVLFDEDPVTLIRQTTRNFHTDSDLQAISRITSSLSTLRSARSLRLNAQQTQLSQLSRRAHHLRTTHDADISRHDPAAHASDILALDTEKFRVAKAANELEIEGERLGSEVYGLKKQLQKLEEQGDEVESAENKAEDEVVYVLSLHVPTTTNQSYPGCPKTDNAIQIKTRRLPQSGNRRRTRPQHRRFHPCSY
ncbi:kinetochore protein-like protein spc24 [Aureobasidium pullulans]|nr:kinetochore protein-like protein spc24 [Aureobasidium pullulans]TIA62378.1 kinetochore protein-like protein spc24 [Aureobasidium pullulans]